MTDYLIRFKDAKRTDVTIRATDARLEDFSEHPAILFQNDDGETIQSISSRDVLMWGRKDAIVDGV
jgi:hypothetical protein